MKPRSAFDRTPDSWPTHRAKRRRKARARVKRQPVRHRPQRKEVKPWWQTATPDGRKPQ